MRASSAAPIDALAARIDLPNGPDTRDRKYEIPEPGGPGDFIADGRSRELIPGERLFLTERLIDCFEQIGATAAADPR